MLTESEFIIWCRHLNLSEQTRNKVQHIRSSQPSRRVGGGKKNVCGRYPSLKMGQTIQFESHRNELAHIYKLECDEDVLEYYDQPPPIELDYLSLKGRHIRHQHTPDFFVIRKNSVGWEECKTEEELRKKLQESPHRYQLEQGNWKCPPGESYASVYGLYYRLQSSAQIDTIFQKNFIWLEDYFQTESLEIDAALTKSFRSIVEADPGIYLSELLHRVEGASVDKLNILLATNKLYVDLSAACLSQPEQVQVFLDKEEALTYAQIKKVSPLTVNNVRAIKVTVGASISWDGKYWEIVNTGETSIGLLSADKKLIELPNNQFEDLVQQGKIAGFQTQIEASINPEVEKLVLGASKKDREEANRRYKAIEPYLNQNSSTKPNRSQHRWIARYQKAEAMYGRGFVGLLPNHQEKGNRLAKLSEEARSLMEKFIEDKYESLKQHSVSHTYRCFKEECFNQGINPPSRELFRLAVKQRSGYQQTRKRMGERAAYKKEPFYWRLDREKTPPHGERPFEICHIDHTEADTELVSSFMATISDDITYLKDNPSDRPWLTVMIDAYSRRILAAYLTFDPPSYRSCMMVLRICVQRFGRLPQTIVVDGGSEFNSTYFETLLAYFRVTKKQRPPTKARFGSVIERFFGVANQEFWHNLRGNTQITRNVRQVTKGVSPKNQAVWTLGKAYSYFCEYAYEVYDTSPHIALRQSPRDAFNVGIARGGSREHLLIPYDEFRLLALPSPTEGQGKRKVTRQGVKINYFYYWHQSFSRVGVENTKVDVKYDPFDISVAYAYIAKDKEWVKCSCGYLQELQGRSERELMIAAAELRKLNTIQNRQFIEITGKKLAQFFVSVEKEEIALTPPWREAKKAVLTQHQRDVELKQVHALIEGKLLEADADDSLCFEDSLADETERFVESAEHFTDLANKSTDDCYQPMEVW